MRFFKKLSIATQLIINGALTLLVVIFIVTLSYYSISKIFMDKNKNYTKEITSSIQYSVARYSQELRSILQNIGYDPNVQKLYSSDNLIDTHNVGKELNILAMNMVEIKKDIFDIGIIGKNGEYFTMGGNYERIKDLMKSIPEDGKVYNTGFEKLKRVNMADKIYFLYGMYFYSSEPDTFAKKLGFVAIMVNLEPIFDEINKISNNTEIKYYLVDKNGMIYSPDDPLNINNSIEIQNLLVNAESNGSGPRILMINGSKNIVNINNIPEIEGKIVSFVQEKELLSEIVQTRNLVFKILFIALIVIGVLFLVTTENIIRPINKLIFFMNSIKTGSIKGLKKRVQLEGSSEINIMANEFNSMLNEIDSLTRRLIDTSSRLYEVEIEKDKAELAFLRSQINPHFLYNTLEVMKGIALEEEVYKLYDMTKALALIFRYSVNGSSTVTLNDEINIIRAYIQIHIIRFGNRLEAVFNFEESTKNAMILKMILQPLVENAIYHGLEPKTDKGILDVGSKYEGEHLIIWVEDNGVGINAEKLGYIQKCLSISPHTLSNIGQSDMKVDSIGIYNINNRLKLTYGEEYGLRIKSKINKGTKIIIRIPREGVQNV